MADMIFNGPSIFNGMPIRESLLLTVPHDDWSKVRSPGRARRRIKLGYRQNIRRIHVPNPDVFVIHGIIHGHPETIKKMLALAGKAGAA